MNSKKQIILDTIDDIFIQNEKQENTVNLLRVMVLDMFDEMDQLKRENKMYELKKTELENNIIKLIESYTG